MTSNNVPNLLTMLGKLFLKSDSTKLQVTLNKIIVITFKLHATIEQKKKIINIFFTGYQNY